MLENIAFSRDVKINVLERVDNLFNMTRVVLVRIKFQDTRYKGFKMLFTSEFNKVMWFIKRKLGVSQKVAYRLARQAVQLGYDARLINAGSIFTDWSYNNARSIAGHLWGLHKAYKETGDTGRSVAFYRAASALYAMADERGTVDVAEFHAQKFVGDSIADECVDFYLAAHTSGFTPRTVALITQHGADNYAQRVHRACWSY